MASIFRQRYTRFDSKGKRIRGKSKKWYIEYKDGSGKTVRVPGFADKKATEHLAAQLQQEAERIRSGLLPADVRQASRSLAEHVADFAAYLRSKPASEIHVDKSIKRINAAIAGLEWSRPGDANATALMAWLAARRADGLATETTNHYLRAVKSLFAWMMRDGRIASNPIVGVKCSNAEVDRRRVRRVLSEAEFAKLLATVRGSYLIHYHLDGRQRHALYATAAYTGLRANELASLTIDSLDFAAGTVTVEAPKSKRRTRDVLPLHPDLAELLHHFVDVTKLVGPLWPGRSWSHNGSEILARDLAEADIERDTPAGRFDFHAIRSQFITGLARAGVSLAVAQRLARHSTPLLTANVYSRFGHADLAAGVGKLPKLV